ncbi:MAG: hypothetical protein ABEJ78_09545 [Haloferacaceae archaeon]
MRRLLAGLALVLAVSLAFGPGSYTVVSAARSVDIATAPDSKAYLGVESGSLSRCGGNQTFVTLSNRFGAGVALDVEVEIVDTAGGLRASVTDHPTTLGGGDSDVVRGRVTPTDGAGGDESMTLAISATSEEARVSLRRTYPVACAKSERNSKSAGNSTA